MLDSARWAELYNEASSTKYYSDETIQKYREHSDPDLYPDVDWFDALFDDMAENQRVNLSITGGGDIVKYYVSGSFYNESSIYKMQETYMDTIHLLITTNSTSVPI